MSKIQDWAVAQVKRVQNEPILVLYFLLVTAVFTVAIWFRGRSLLGVWGASVGKITVSLT